MSETGLIAHTWFGKDELACSYRMEGRLFPKPNMEVSE